MLSHYDITHPSMAVTVEDLAMAPLGQRYLVGTRKRTIRDVNFVKGEHLVQQNTYVWTEKNSYTETTKEIIFDDFTLCCFEVTNIHLKDAYPEDICLIFLVPKTFTFLLVFPRLKML